jgi:hypothetical protein
MNMKILLAWLLSGLMVFGQGLTVGTNYVSLSGNTNRVTDTGSALAYNGVAIGGGTTINPTDKYTPYRFNSTTFSNTPLYRISDNRMGFASTNFFMFSEYSVLENLGVGNDTLKSITSGGNDTAFGHGVMSATTIGSANSGFGDGALSQLTQATDNTAVGFQALSANLTAVNNTAVGSQALISTTGSDNTALGSLAGITNTTGRYNVLLGVNANASANSNTNSIVIGHRSIGKGTSTAVIGNSTVTVLWLGGEVGWFKGTGDPENAVTAPIGSIYSRKDGGALTSFYVKESGTGNTGWVAK